MEYPYNDLNEHWLWEAKNCPKVHEIYRMKLAVMEKYFPFAIPNDVNIGFR
jgi:hypothetical protein